jgi:probable F420-dependent oxidoreductase
MAPADIVARTRTALGPVGVWISGVGRAPEPAAAERHELARIERLGFGSAWTGEFPGGRDAFAHHGIYLAGTDRLVVGTGIANVWSRPAPTTQGAAVALADAYPGRFVLGLGIGHRFQAENAGGSWRPTELLTRYLDELDAAAGGPLLPPVEFPRVIGAIGPRMLDLAAERTDGAHPFFTTVEHTAEARRLLGPDKLLIPTLPVHLEEDPARARAELRESTRLGASMPAYARNLRHFGFSAADLAEASDRLVDATHAHGDAAAVIARIREQLDAGADHVLLSPHAADLSAAVDVLDRLAPALADAGLLAARAAV